MLQSVPPSVQTLSQKTTFVPSADHAAQASTMLLSARGASTIVVVPVVRFRIWNAPLLSAVRRRTPSEFQLGAAKPQPCSGTFRVATSAPVVSSVIPSPPNG